MILTMAHGAMGSVEPMGPWGPRPWLAYSHPTAYCILPTSIAHCPGPTACCQFIIEQPEHTWCTAAAKSQAWPWVVTGR